MWGHLVYAFGSEASASPAADPSHHSPSRWFGSIAYNVWFMSPQLRAFYELKSLAQEGLDQIVDRTAGWPVQGQIAGYRTFLKVIAEAAEIPDFAQKIFDNEYRPLLYKAKKMNRLQQMRFC